MKTKVEITVKCSSESVRLCDMPTPNYGELCQTFYVDAPIKNELLFGCLAKLEHQIRAEATSMQNGAENQGALPLDDVVRIAQVIVTLHKLLESKQASARDVLSGLVFARDQIERVLLEAEKR